MDKRAVLYARVSTDDGQNATSSLAGQLDMCRARAADRGYTVVAELADDGVSGKRLDAPELNRALDMARAGQFDVLIVREMDRLSRSLAKQLIVEEELKRDGVTVEYVIGEYVDTPEGNLTKHIRAVIAEYERLKITERLVRGRRRLAAQGAVLVNQRPPYGYDVVVNEDGKRYALAVNEGQAEIVRLIYHLYIVVGLAAYDIAGRLNDAGIPSPRGGEWYPTVVHRMLGNETYAGVWRYGKGNKGGKNPAESHIPVTVPALVDRRTWEAAQARKIQNASDSFRNRKHDYLLARRSSCGACGRAMYINGRRYYHCPATRGRFSATSCDARDYFRVDVVDDLAWRWVCRLLLDPEAVEQGYARFNAQLDKELAPLRRQLATAESLLDKERAKLGRLLDLYLSGDLARELLSERQARLEATVRALTAQRDALADRIRTAEAGRVDIPQLREFVARVADGVAAVDASGNFTDKRAIIDRLDVRARLIVEEGERVAYLSCKVGHGRIAITKQNVFGEFPNRDTLLITLTSRIELRSALNDEFIKRLAVGVSGDDERAD